MKKNHILVLSLLMVGLLASNVFGDDVSGAISSANSWISETLGPVILVLGILVAGIYIVLGNKLGMYKSLWAVGGGLVITLSAKIADLVTGWGI